MAYTLSQKRDLMVALSENFRLLPLLGKAPHPQHDTRGWDLSSRILIPDPSLHIGNYGVIADDGFLIIDVDPRRTSQGSQLAELLQILPPSTFTVNTGGGGQHIYTSIPSTTPKLRKRLPQFPEVDFIRGAMYVVGPGSIHPETLLPYTHINHPSQIDAAPAHLLDLLQVSTQTKTAETPNNRPIAETDPEAISTYALYLQEHPGATEGQHGDETTFTLLARGRDLGLPQPLILSLALQLWNHKCNPQWSPQALKTKIQNVFKYAQNPEGAKAPQNQFSMIPTQDQDPTKNAETLQSDDLLDWEITKAGEIKKTLTNTVNFFLSEKHGLKNILRLNTFSQQLEFHKNPPWTDQLQKGWTDSDSIHAKYYLAKRYGFEVPAPLITEAAIAVANNRRYHPVMEYLNDLKWDQVPRVSTWLQTYCGAPDTPYTRAIGTKTLAAAIARVFEPGIKFDHVLILEGKQGIGKSTVCQILGGKWYADFQIDPAQKDTVSALIGSWIVEMSEMTTSRKSEADALKAFISRTTDRVRLPYARNTANFPRSCIFIGTINPEENTGYLKDQTGNRRFWPVPIEFVKTPELRRDVDQLWAEAIHLYQQGESLHLENEDTQQLAAQEAAKRQIVDPWVSTITNYVKAQLEIESFDREPFFADAIYTDVIRGELSRFSSSDRSRINGVLRSLGLQGKTRYSVQKKGSHYGFLPPEEPTCAT